MWQFYSSNSRCTASIVVIIYAPPPPSTPRPQDSVPYLRLFLYHQQQFIKRYLAILQQKKKQQLSATATAATVTATVTVATPTLPQTAPSGGGTASLTTTTAGVKVSDLQKQALAINRLPPEQRQLLMQQHSHLLSPQLKQLMVQLQQKEKGKWAEREGEGGARESGLNKTCSRVVPVEMGCVSLLLLCSCLFCSSCPRYSGWLQGGPHPGHAPSWLQPSPTGATPDTARAAQAACQEDLQ